MVGGYVGSQRDRERADRLQREREEAKKRFEDVRSEVEKKGSLTLRQFGASKDEVLDAAFQNETVGLVTREEFASKRASVDERLAGEKRGAKAADPEAVREAELRAKRARAAQRAKLSFGDDSDGEEEGEGEGERDAPAPTGGLAARLGDGGTSTRDGCEPSARGESSDRDDGGVASTSGEADVGGAAAPGGRGAAGAPTSPAAAALRSAAPLRLGKDPTVKADFLPDRERDAREAALREQLKQEWQEEQERVKAEPLEVTYSFWNGTGHRRVAEMKKGDTIGHFLKVALEALRPTFRELRAVEASALMFVKEDVILPSTATFYQLIVNKAQGRSGPLFEFSVQSHLARSFDPRQVSRDTHPGKIVERAWYSRNRHVFPATKWRQYDAERNVLMEAEAIPGRNYQ